MRDSADRCRAWGHRPECPLVARLGWQVWECDRRCARVETCPAPVYDRDGLGCGPCGEPLPCAEHR